MAAAAASRLAPPRVITLSPTAPSPSLPPAALRRGGRAARAGGRHRRRPLGAFSLPPSSLLLTFSLSHAPPLAHAAPPSPLRATGLRRRRRPLPLPARRARGAGSQVVAAARGAAPRPGRRHRRMARPRRLRRNAPRISSRRLHRHHAAAAEPQQRRPRRVAAGGRGRRALLPRPGAIGLLFLGPGLHAAPAGCAGGEPVAGGAPGPHACPLCLSKPPA